MRLIALSWAGATIAGTMLGFLITLVSAVVLLGALVATILVQGGWEPVAAAIAVLAGSAALGGLVLMLTLADGRSRP